MRIIPSNWIKEGLPFKAKILIAVFMLFITIGGGIVGYKFYDYTRNNPKFCVSCHIMQPSYEAWEKSEHRDINCHECHRLTIPEMNKLLFSFIVKRPATIPERHGKIIVTWQYCAKCHLEKNVMFKAAKRINRSRMHAKHVFMEQIECVKCHGYIIHKFTAEEGFCVKCHQQKIVHGTGMEKLACLNCHTDRTEDLRPGPKKCLFCHGSEKIRQELIAGGTLDVTHYQPDEETIKRAIKINRPENAPMQFNCYECHKPHESARPDWNDCFKCHKNVIKIGKHYTHVEIMGIACKKCHKPHIWNVTKKQARKDCILCHDYKDPATFIGP